jgi:subtilisin family serine protease
MSNRFLLATAAAALGAHVTLAAAATAPRPYVITYTSSTVPANAASTISAAGGRLVRTIPDVGLAIAVAERSSFASAIRKSASVASAELATGWKIERAAARQVPSSKGPTVEDQYYNAGEVWGVDRVHAPQAWDAGYTGSHSAVVAVIDTGIAWNHPDLAGNVVHVDCYTMAGSYADGACNPYPEFSLHGTHVAGTVAAQFGGGKVVGVAPDAGLASYNTFEVIPDCGVCTYDFTRWQAMIDAARRGFKVINMSLGGYGFIGGPGTNELTAFLAADKRVIDYVTKLGTAVVSSSGNGGVNLNGPIVHIPGDSPGAINTGATGIRPNPRFEPGVSYDVIAFYSNYGAPVDISAPGGDCGEDLDCTASLPNWFEYLVLSTGVDLGSAEETGVPAKCARRAACDTGYWYLGGTSMATPHVSGVAALVYAANPGISASQVKSVLKQTADDVGNRLLFGAGVVDAAAAVGAP